MIVLYLKYKEKLLEKLTENYDKEVAKQKDNVKFIMNLIDILEQNLGQEINKLNTSLVNNIYILDHDHLGNSLDKPFTITEKDKVIFKEFVSLSYKTSLTPSPSSVLIIFFSAKLSFFEKSFEL